MYEYTYIMYNMGRLWWYILYAQTVLLLSAPYNVRNIILENLHVVDKDYAGALWNTAPPLTPNYCLVRKYCTELYNKVMGLVIGKSLWFVLDITCLLSFILKSAYI